ncbi:MAG: universal stress protein [Gammaproteobacteria bacterium]|nr:universal stress protein [Gammaproteobacteria bacterium]MDH3448326.1 universal stress protein [Gammaproteobacteria bacterium]
MFNTILLPVDVAHLDEGRKSLDVALSITGSEAAITLLYVMEDIPNWTDIDLPSNFKENSMQKAREALESIIDNNDRKISVEVRAGHTYSTILKEAKATNADLIILASHKPGLIDYFLGSNTSKVVNHADCSVVVVR